MYTYYRVETRTPRRDHTVESTDHLTATDWFFMECCALADLGYNVHPMNDHTAVVYDHNHMTKNAIGTVTVLTRHDRPWVEII